MAKLLVIDDDEAVRGLIVRTLGADHQVTEAPDGRAGMRLFREDAPDMVITDIMMPHRDGIETIREIREAGSKIGIIAMSGGGVRAGALYLSLAKDFGADATLQKPFRADALRAAVDEVLKRDLPAA
jgi:DNA-binding response OmpR family regulator